MEKKSPVSIFRVALLLLLPVSCSHLTADIKQAEIQGSTPVRLADALEIVQTNLRETRPMVLSDATAAPAGTPIPNPASPGEKRIVENIEAAQCAMGVANPIVPLISGSEWSPSWIAAGCTVAPKP
jgi:hypothetical protein